MDNQNEMMSEHEKNIAARNADMEHAPKKKSNCLKIFLIGLLVLFFFLVGTIIIGGTLMKKFFKSMPGVPKGSGKVETQVRDLDTFTKIDLSGASNLEIICGSEEQKVEVVADDNLVNLIETEVTDGTLHITSVGAMPMGSSTFDLRIHIKQLDELIVSGAGTVNIKNLDNEKTRISLSGAGNVKMEDVKCGTLSLDSSGAAKVNAGGECEEVNIDLSGAGGVNLKELKAKIVNISISGAGGADVYASDSLNVDISGMGKVTYYGDPKNVKKQVSGVGSLEKK